MFEKDAEEYATTGYDKKLLTKEEITVLKCGRYDGFQKGASFGYNKAKVEVEDSYRESLCNSELNLVSVTERLGQARNLIDKFVNSSPYKTSSAEYFYKDLIKEAKQFLNESE